MRVIAGIPSNGMWHARFGLAWSGLLATALNDFTLMPVDGQSSIVADARNVCLEQADRLGADAILFLDTDMAFPPVLLHMLAAIDQPIVAATYRQRFPGGVILGHELDGSPITQAGLGAMPPREVLDLPTGAMLIRRRAWEDMPKPYFRFGVNELTGRLVGEDIMFCRRARERGMSVWLEPHVSCHMEHYGLVPFPTMFPNVEVIHGRESDVQEVA